MINFNSFLINYSLL